MEVISVFPDRGWPTSTITVGNFDGCHRGHRYLLDRLVHLARESKQRSVVITFTNGSDKERLFTPAHKVAAFSEIGVDYCLMQKFDRRFAAVSHQVFLQDYLKRRLSMQNLVVGDDFKFGRDRQGSVSWLLSQTGFKLEVVASCLYEHKRISSSGIRDLITKNGDVETVSRMLGTDSTRFYLLEGVVVRGEQRGRTLGIPTANLAQIKQLIPKNGVYAGQAVIGDMPPVLRIPSAGRIPCVINVGTRPTVTTGRGRVVEAHLIGRSFGYDSLYGKTIFLLFQSRLRDEIEFPDTQALLAQIKIDIATATNKLNLATRRA